MTQLCVLVRSDAFSAFLLCYFRLCSNKSPPGQSYTSFLGEERSLLAASCFRIPREPLSAPKTSPNIVTVMERFNEYPTRPQVLIQTHIQKQETL